MACVQSCTRISCDSCVYGYTGALRANIARPSAATRLAGKETASQPSCIQIAWDKRSEKLAVLVRGPRQPTTAENVLIYKVWARPPPTATATAAPRHCHSHCHCRAPPLPLPLPLPRPPTPTATAATPHCRWYCYVERVLCAGILVHFERIVRRYLAWTGGTAA